jgi:uncharacterized protein (TIGR02646 family)
MISYPTPPDGLEREIKKRYPKWSPDWKRLKPLFGEIQHRKCAYCERKLDKNKHSFEGDIDHYRPKSKYPQLTHTPTNYVLTCDICNRSYKGDAFPMKGSYAGQTETRPASLKREDPDFVHPLDPTEPKLEDIIGFLGVIASSQALSGSREEERANAMIARFNLNGRDDLREERIKDMELIYLAFTNRTNPVAQSVIVRAESPSEAHSNFARCYLRLCQEDFPTAEALAKAASIAS